MVSARNGPLIVQGEINKLLIAMKRGTTWSSYSQQDEKVENILKKFNSLKIELSNVSDLKEIGSVVFLDPFLDVITSDQTSSSVTSLALVSINTFLSYGLIDSRGRNVTISVCKIAEAVTRAKFSSSNLDSVVLMRILLVLRNLVVSPIGVFLTNENVCEIMSTIFKVCFETSFTELLRKYAEHCLKEIVQCLFTQLSTFSDDSADSVKSINMRSAAVDSSQKSNSKTLSQGDNQGPEDLDSRSTDVNSPDTAPKDTIILATSPCTPSGSMIDMQDATLTPSSETSDHLPDTQPCSLGELPNGVAPGTVEEDTLESNNGVSYENENNTRPNHLAISNCDNPNSESQCLSPAQPPSEVDKNEASGEVAQPNERLESSNIIENTETEAHQTQEPHTISQDNMVNSSRVETEAPNIKNELPEEYFNQQGVRFTVSDPVQEAVSKGPYGIASVRELLHCLVQLCDPHNKNNSESMIHIGLTLLSVAFEVGADSIALFPSLMVIVKDGLCRYLIGLVMSADRLSIFAANLQLLFLVFESMRIHLKFQFEMYLSKLLEIISADNPKFKYEFKEIALESVVQLWKIPGLVTELYLNYDCNLYCPNLYEDQTKMLSKNCFPMQGIYNVHLLSLDALLTVIDSIENYCKQKTLNENNETTVTRAKSSQETGHSIPSHEELMAIKRKKKLLTIGTEQFNMNSKKGIKFLQEQGLLSTPLDPLEIVHFLRENPHLDKKTIGEYLSNRSNLSVLDQFVRSFDFTNTRIDLALRMYLETFRLPGESPLISLLMEQFADHWHKSNGEPFASADAAFTLVYAIIMLNVDQHNYNVKRQNNPMSAEAFKKNLKAVNGGEDFDQSMLDNIYKSIKDEEIVMPAEQTGLVRENYLWKVLLKRGQGKDGAFITAPDGQHNNYNHDLFSIIFTPTVAALSYVFDKSTDSAICGKAMTGFRKCAMISAYYGMSNEFDNLTHTLCKFSTLLNIPETSDNPIAVFGCNTKARISTKTVFDWAHRHGDILREGWKPILDCILQLYEWKLLPKILVEAEDFLEISGKISLLREETSISTKNDKGFFSTFYNSLSLIAFTADQPLQREPTSEEQKYIEQAQKCIMECPLEVLITESKFFRLDSLDHFVKALVAASYGTEGHVTLETSLNEDTTVFFLEFLLKVVIQNRDRVSPIWQCVRDHLYTLLMRGAAMDQHFLVERTIVGVLRLAIRLMSREEMSPVVLQSLRMLLLLKWSTLTRVSREIAYGLYELLKTSAANIHTDTDWAIIFTLLECVGAGRPPPKVVGQNTSSSVGQTGAKSDGEVTSQACEEDSGLGNERGYTSDSELIKPIPIISQKQQSPELSPNTGSSWILVGREGEIQPFSTKPILTNEFFLNVEKELFPHDPYALVKCCESLAFLVRDAAHITPYNFENCVRCIRTFVEAVLESGEKKKPGKSNMKEKSRRKMSRKKSEDRTRSPTNSPYDADESDPEELPNIYPRVYIQLLDLMHTLHIRTAQIYRWWADENPETEMMSLWSQGWCPLLQGIARLCCDTRKDVRMSAITYLQRALLVHDLQTLTGDEWESCFNNVLFPLLAKLLEDINEDDVVGMEETRMRAATLLSKVFLHHLSPLLVLTTFTQLWLHILDFMDKYMHADGSDLLGEAIPESLKNILLVMDSAKVFSSNDGYSYLWTITWDRINLFLPHLKEELFKSHPSVEGFDSAPNKSDTFIIPSNDSPPSQPSPLVQNQPLLPPSNSQSQSVSYPQANVPHNALPPQHHQHQLPTPFLPKQPSTPVSLTTQVDHLQSFLPIPVSAPYQQSVYSISGGAHNLHVGETITNSSTEFYSSSFGANLSAPSSLPVQQEVSSGGGLPTSSSRAFVQYNLSQANRLPETDVSVGSMPAPHPIINIVTQPQSYVNMSAGFISQQSDPGAPPKLTEEVVSPSNAIPVPARHAAPLFPQLISTPVGHPPLRSPPASDSILSAFVPTPSSNPPQMYTPPISSHNLFTIFPPGGGSPSSGGSGHHGGNSSADRENAKNFFYQNIPNSTSENVLNQSIGSPPRAVSGLLLNPDMTNIASLPSVVSQHDS